VTFVDSTALGVLIGATKQLQATDGALAIVCPHEKIRRVFQITGLDRVLAMHASRDEAFSAVP
jgi:anti-sigma B factor antagonist